jgi:DnaJ-class molecular chaperone
VEAKKPTPKDHKSVVLTGHCGTLDIGRPSLKVLPIKVRLAKKLHPDLNPGNKESEERFKEVVGAYDLVSDQDKRLRFDSGEIDASGAERPRERFYKDFAAEAAAGHPYENRSGFADFTEADGIFAELFRRQAQESRRARGPDLHYRLSIDFLDAVNGATKRLTLPEGDRAGRRPRSRG